MSVTAAQVRAILRDSSDRGRFSDGVGMYYVWLFFQDAICMVIGKGSEVAGRFVRLVLDCTIFKADTRQQTG